MLFSQQENAPGTTCVLVPDIAHSPTIARFLCTQRIITELTGGPTAILKYSSGLPQKVRILYCYAIFMDLEMEVCNFQIFVFTLKTLKSYQFGGKKSFLKIHEPLRQEQILRLRPQSQRGRGTNQKPRAKANQNYKIKVPQITD